MKIHYLSQSILISDSANSVHVCRMCDAFHGLGESVTLHAMKGEGTDADVRAYYGLGEDVSLRRHGFDHPFARLTAGAKAHLSGFGFGALTSALQGRFQLRAELAKAKPDLIYARNLEWLWTAAPQGVPFALECHAPPAHAVAQRIIRQLIARPGFRGVIVISGPLKDIFLNRFPSLAGRILVSHDGADLLDPAAKTEPHEGFHVGYVGHLYSGRGAELILELARRLPEATFHFVGGTPEDIARLRSNAPGNTMFHGHVPHAETPRFYRNFDAMLAPYQPKVSVHGGLGDTSAFMSPLKIFEYMAWGKPILCSNHSVLREVLSDGTTAILLEPDDVDAWEAALRRLMQDRALAARLGAAARALLERSYTWKERCRRILEWLGLLERPEPCSSSSIGNAFLEGKGRLR